MAEVARGSKAEEGMIKSGKSRRIDYWKKVQLTPWAEIELVPIRTIEEGPLWIEIVAAIKASGFDYCIVETEQTITEGNLIHGKQ